MASWREQGIEVMKEAETTQQLDGGRRVVEKGASEVSRETQSMEESWERGESKGI